MDLINEGYVTEYQFVEAIADTLAERYGVEDVCITAQTVGDNDYKLKISGRQTRLMDMGPEGTSVKFLPSSYGSREQFGEVVNSYTAHISPGAGYSSIEVDVELHSKFGSLFPDDTFDFGVAPLASLRVTSLVGAQPITLTGLEGLYDPKREGPFDSYKILLNKDQSSGFPRIVSLIDDGQREPNTLPVHKKFTEKTQFGKMLGEKPFVDLSDPDMYRANPELQRLIYEGNFRYTAPVRNAFGMDVGFERKSTLPADKEEKINLDGYSLPQKKSVDLDKLPAPFKQHKLFLTDFGTSQHLVETENPLAVLGRRPLGVFETFGPEINRFFKSDVSPSDLNKDSGEE